MTWQADIVGVQGKAYGVIRDEYNVPMEDGDRILRWMFRHPRFTQRIKELSCRLHSK